MAKKQFDLPTVEIPSRYQYFFNWFKPTDAKIGWSFLMAIIIGLLSGPALMFLGVCGSVLPALDSSACVGGNQLLISLSIAISWPFYLFASLPQGMFVYFGILALWLYYYIMISIAGRLVIKIGPDRDA